MNDLDLLSRLRQEVPLTPVSTRDEEQLLAAIAGTGASTGAAPASAAAGTRAGDGRPATPARPRRALKLAAAGGLSLALAAGIIFASSVPRGRSRPPSSANAAVLAVTQHAAIAALAKPGIAPGQWVYFKEVDQTSGGPAATSDGWETADGTQMAVVSNGRVRIYGITATIHSINVRDGLAPLNSITYGSLGSLPSDPKALVTYMEKLFPGTPASQLPAKAFQAIGELLTVYVMPPAFTAELYRAIADTPGVTVVTGVKDLAGQEVIALRYKRPTELLGYEIYLDPASYDYLGTVSLSKVAGGKLAPSGYAIITYANVSGPGVTP